MATQIFEIPTAVQAPPPASRVHGSDVFEYLADNPDHHEVFNRAMTEMTMSTAPAIVEAYEFSSFETIVDIAGGHGDLLSQILKATPGLRGVLFDVEPVIAGAGTILEKEAHAKLLIVEMVVPEGNEPHYWPAQVCAWTASSRLKLP